MEEVWHRTTGPSTRKGTRRSFRVGLERKEWRAELIMPGFLPASISAQVRGEAVSRADNEQIMRTYLQEVVAKGRLDLIPEIAAENMVDEVIEAEGGPPGREGLIAHVMGFHADFPSRTITIRKILANDDGVMAWWTAEGTPATEFGGVPPTGKRVLVHVFSFFGITDGKIFRYRLFAHFGFDTPVVLDTTPAADIPDPVPAAADVS
jgi:steroid delta-isomerase-like uncharacterized protein